MAEVLRDEQRPAGEIDRSIVDALAGNFRGEIICPGDEQYDDARHVFNGMIDRRPGLIARCLNPADVVQAVNVARSYELPLSVRGGGHNVAGLALNDGGIVVDLSKMREVRVDPEKRVARVAGGATWADVDGATHQFGLATPGGQVSSTGVGGLTLGGGLGHLTRAFGLCIDNLLSVEIVTADGRLLTANADQEADLFWAVRGGGGNFGVVTAFEFRLHPVNMVYSGPIVYPAERAGDALRLYREFLAGAPDELSAIFAYLIVPPAPPFPEHLWLQTMCAILPNWIGPLDQGEQVVKPLRDAMPAALDMMGPMPYPVLQSMFDPMAPFGLQQYWKSDLVPELSDDMIAIHQEYGPRIPTPVSIVHIYPVDGAAGRVGSADTAYAHRDARFVHVIAAASPDPAETPQQVSWVRDYWSALHPYASGSYSNFLMEEGADRTRAAYGGNYERLSLIKRRYDPENLFRFNHNIALAG